MPTRVPVAGVTVMAAAMLFGLSAPLTASEPGLRDSAFGRDGVRRVDFGHSEEATAVYPRESGQLLLAGRSERGLVGRDHRLALALLNDDGTDDRSFGQRGRKLVDPTPWEDIGYAWAPVPSGGMVVVGDHGSQEECGGRTTCTGFFLVRFDPTGRVDRSFGSDGVVVGRFSSGSAIDDVLVQRNGKILVMEDSDPGTVVRRYRVDGTRDMDFATEGRIRLPNVYNAALATQPSGRLIVMGNRRRNEIVLSGRLANGDVDQAFGRDGRGSLRIRNQRFDFTALDSTTAPDGPIVAIGVGRLRDTFSFDTLVARFTSGGKPDKSFGNGDGWLRIDVGEVDSPEDVVATSRGVVVVGGVGEDVFGDDPSGDLFIAAMKGDGRLRRSFGEGGIVRDDFGRDDDAVIGLDVEMVSGKLVVVGAVGPGSGVGSDMFAARYFYGRW